MKKFCSLLSTLLLILLLLLTLAFVGPMLLGYREMTVLSGSMEPELPVGSIICVDDDVPLSGLEPGDVITYRLDSATFVTHRLIRLDPSSETLITQGDANEAEDAPVAFSQYYGRVAFHIPCLGYLASNIRTPAGIMTVTGVVILIILLNTLPALLARETSDEPHQKKE